MSSLKNEALKWINAADAQGAQVDGFRFGF